MTMSEADLEKTVGEIKPNRCMSCDFSFGTRGMDRCSKCDGTGSIFRVGLRVFPNTQDGYMRALIAKQSERGAQMTEEGG